jgi:hypothetical protein
MREGAFKHSSPAAFARGSDPTGDVLRDVCVVASAALTKATNSKPESRRLSSSSATETLPDEVSGGPSQTASYSATESSPDDDTAYETGTETLGSGGTISGGSASFSWSVENSLNRNLGITGIAANLTITESSTDSYGFAESGTEDITTGGADEPGTVSFDWSVNESVTWGVVGETGQF